MLDQLPPEILVHIFSYLYQCPKKEISYHYHLNNNNLNQVNRKIANVIEHNKHALCIHNPTHVLGYYWAKNLINN